MEMVLFKHFQRNDDFMSLEATEQKSQRKTRLTYSI